MANARMLLETPNAELDAQLDRARMRRLAVLFDEVTYRVVSLRARASSLDISVEERTRLSEELAALEDDWRCLASAHIFSATHARVG